MDLPKPSTERRQGQPDPKSNDVSTGTRVDAPHPISSQRLAMAAAGDAGGAVGAALTVWHNVLGHPREVDEGKDAMQGAYLGPEFSRDQIKEYLDANGYPYEEVPDDQWGRRVAELIANERVVGVCRGRMEFGPRALGNRSIIGDARSPRMQSIMNLKIKYRESFRPFAPSILGEDVREYFAHEIESPYMLMVAPVREGRRRAMTKDEEMLFGIDKLAFQFLVVSDVSGNT